MYTDPVRKFYNTVLSMTIEWRIAAILIVSQRIETSYRRRQKLAGMICFSAYRGPVGFWTT